MYVLYVLDVPARIYTCWTPSVTEVVDPYAQTPAYVQVADAVEALIRAGKLRALMPIPSETHLRQQYGVSRGTARQAVRLLRERGLVITVQGRGSYVSEQAIPES